MSLADSYSPRSDLSSPDLSPLSIEENNKTATATKKFRFLDLLCAICSKPATGHHYSVPSCNACKTFFRRVVLSNQRLECLNTSFSCTLDGRANKYGIKAKMCPSCRMKSCLENGMRKEVVNIYSQSNLKSSIHNYVDTIEEPKTSVKFESFTPKRSRQILRLISKFRRTNVRVEEMNIPIRDALLNINFLDNIANYDIKDINHFNRTLPDWFTIDLASAIEFAKKIPDFVLYTTADKEELIRSSCLTVAIAIQAIDSYLADQKRITLPDGSDMIERAVASTSIDFNYSQTFILILEPLYREQFTIDEIVLSIQLLFYSIAIPENLSENGKQQLETSIISSMRSLFNLLISKDKSTFTTRYGSLIGMNEVFIKVAAVHKTKMQENKDLRRKHHDILIEQIVFNLRL